MKVDMKLQLGGYYIFGVHIFSLIAMSNACWSYIFFIYIYAMSDKWTIERKSFRPNCMSQRVDNELSKF